jgi:serine/threonine protein kinase
MLCSYVAAKNIQGSFAKRELHREMVMFAALRHPNVLNLIGLGTCSRDREYILTELHEGSLFELIHIPERLGAPQQLSNRNIIELARGIIAALIYLHSLHVAHVDVKSANVLLDMTSSSNLAEPKICDFGHAQLMPRNGASRKIRRYGTPNYAAPECLRCESITTAVDIWSFGVVLYEMQTKEVPHHNLSQGQIVTAVGWAGLRPDCSALSFEGLAEVTSKCLQGCPSVRPDAMKLQKEIRAIKSTARRQTWEMLSGFF